MHLYEFNAYEILYMKIKIKLFILFDALMKFDAYEFI